MSLSFILRMVVGPEEDRLVHELEGLVPQNQVQVVGQLRVDVHQQLGELRPHPGKGMFNCKVI